MSSSVFLVSGDNVLTELKQSDYDSEALFQSLLADHPALLGITSGADGRLLLVRREFGVPEEQDGSSRWSLDHLFLDQDGVPVLVEVKRATDTRARREVVAQMLDYAANGIAYWPIDRVVDAYRETCTVTGADPDDHLAAFLGGGKPEQFWRQVEANLRSGRVRLLFVADKIPKELRRIVEFLNEQMRPAEVLALEVEQFVSATGIRTLVPRLVGATARAESAKSVTPRTQAMSETEWLDQLGTAKGEAAKRGAERAIQWFRSHGFAVGITESQDTVYANLTRPSGKQTWPFFLRMSTGRLELALQYLKNDPAFADDQRRLELLNEMKAIPGVSIITTKLTGWPAIPLPDLLNEQVWTAVEAIASRVKVGIERGS